jgi:hypothetical protein
MFWKRSRGRPSIRFRRLCQARGDRILEHVLGRMAAMLVGLDHPRGEARAEEVTRPRVTVVEALCVAAVQVLDARGELRLRRLDDQVDVVRHQTEGVDPPSVPRDRQREQVHVHAAVVVVAVDGGAVDAACGDVEDAVRELGAEDARHARRP